MIQFDEYFETSSDMMLVSDMEGIIQRVNSAWKKNLG